MNRLGKHLVYSPLIAEQIGRVKHQYILYFLNYLKQKLNTYQC